MGILKHGAGTQCPSSQRTALSPQGHASFFETPESTKWVFAVHGVVGEFLLTRLPKHLHSANLEGFNRSHS